MSWPVQASTGGRPSVGRTMEGVVARRSRLARGSRICAMSISAQPQARRGTSSSVTHGAGLTFETLLEREAGDAPFRMREHEDTLLRVIAGIVRLSVNGAERLLGIGDEAIVPARSVYRLASAGAVGRA